ncbi:hypothetical protein [Geomonas sp.]|uniref:hypothetical protein n=1 Tax=Geomonas sp. TaxID=2651584 RepID=UPI002B47E7C6|nr:hypothetical protein [Geomonas sp.]HJV35578.1 hypothetical protein [Geomonas sp.]
MQKGCIEFLGGFVVGSIDHDGLYFETATARTVIKMLIETENEKGSIVVAGFRFLRVDAGQIDVAVLDVIEAADRVFAGNRILQVATI